MERQHGHARLARRVKGSAKSAQAAQPQHCTCSALSRYLTQVHMVDSNRRNLKTALRAEFSAQEAPGAAQRHALYGPLNP